jgi:hypothetical protein
MRNTPTGRLQNLGPRGKGTLAALLAQLPAKAQQAARELSADVTALQRFRSVTVQVEPAIGFEG